MSPSDPRIKAVAAVLADGFADLIARCIDAFNGVPPPPPGYVAPESAAIRRQNIPESVAPSVPARALPPEQPPEDQPIDPRGLKIPTWAQLINLYTECAIENYKKNFKPCERVRVANVTGIKKVLSRLDIPLDEPYNRLTRQRISKLEDIGLKEGKSRASIQTWRGYIKSITARWACLAYEDRGWAVSPIATQPFNIAQKAYEALPAETVRRIDEWIASLRANPATREHFKFVWIMRNLAVRNGDVLRFTWGNFTDRGDKVHSAYIPHKTSKTSQRRATWDLPKEKWMEIGEFAGAPDELVVDSAHMDVDAFQRDLNAQIKAILPPGRNKGLYELRKLSAHEAYEQFGPKAAVRKTGDSFDTLNTHYIDSSAGGYDED